MPSQRKLPAASIRRSRAIGLLSCWLLLTACAPTPEIATEETYCCRPAAERVHSYRVAFEDMPEFLKPMLRDEVSRVLRTRHLAYTEGVADAVLTIAFSSSPMARDDTRREGENDALVHFEAELNLEFRNSVTDERIWSGTMSRAHHVAEGETMHDDRARSALRVALSELFADFPDPAWPVR